MSGYLDGGLALDCDCPWEEHGIGLQTVRTTSHRPGCGSTYLAPGGVPAPADARASSRRTEGVPAPEAGAKTDAPSVFELAALIVAGQAFTDQDAIRVARALLDERETA